MMPGVTFGEIRDAIVDAYNNDDLEEVLRIYMNVRLDVEIPPGAFRRRVFELIEWAEMRGVEVELVRVMAQARPRKASMQQIYKKYGMAIPVLVQDGGKAVPASPTDAADGGLEKVVRPHLTFTDFGIWRERMTRVEGQVCRITFNGAARGTGFLVGPDAVLTNYHVFEPVLKDPKTAAGISCQFDYKQLADKSRLVTPIGLHPTDWLIDSSPYTLGESANDPDRTTPTPDELDYALVRLAEPFGAKPAVLNPNTEDSPPARGWVRVPDEAPKFAAKMAMIIAQHPDGEPLKLALDTDAIDHDKDANLGLRPGGMRVRYATNTLGGSSGSPCFDFDWNLVALHHYGDPSYNHPKYNQGIPIGLIRDRLQRQGKVAELGGDQP
jgi:Trypsin-like peptidase domain/Effector-associated domain 1